MWNSGQIFKVAEPQTQRGQSWEGRDFRRGVHIPSTAWHQGDPALKADEREEEKSAKILS